MDKSDQYTYGCKNQFLIVERHFAGDRRIEEIVKQYITEQVSHVAESVDFSEIRRDHPGEKAVGTGAEEESR